MLWAAILWTFTELWKHHPTAVAQMSLEGGLGTTHPGGTKLPSGWSAGTRYWSHSCLWEKRKVRQRTERPTQFLFENLKVLLGTQNKLNKCPMPSSVKGTCASAMQKCKYAAEMQSMWLPEKSHSVQPTTPASTTFTFPRRSEQHPRTYREGTMQLGEQLWLEKGYAHAKPVYCL